MHVIAVSKKQVQPGKKRHWHVYYINEFGEFGSFKIKGHFKWLKAMWYKRQIVKIKRIK